MLEEIKPVRAVVVKVSAVGSTHMDAAEDYFTRAHLEKVLAIAEDLEQQLADARRQLAKRDMDAQRYRAMRWLAISQGDDPKELDAVADALMDQIPERG